MSTSCWSCSEASDTFAAISARESTCGEADVRTRGGPVELDRLRDEAESN